MIVETYQAVQNLVDLLSIKFHFEVTRQTLRLSKYPEVKLVALIIIAVKLAYGLDDVPRNSSSKSEVANVIPQWKDWKAILDSQSGVTKWEATLPERAIYDMDTEALDKYMDWYEESLYAENSGMTWYLILMIYSMLPTSFNC